MILSAQSIRKSCIRHIPLITPFFKRTEVVWDGENWQNFEGSRLDPGLKRYTYGLSSSGYDIRLDQDLWIWPFWGRLGSSMERFHIPRNLIMRVLDKSSLARQFIFVQNTVAEPGWSGYLTLEITNDRLWPRKLRRGQPIAQVIFETLDYPTEQSYQGKYQDQPRGAQKAT